MGATEPLTDDQLKVLRRAHEHPDWTPKQVADSIDDEHIKPAYADRIMADFSLPAELRPEPENGDGSKHANDTEPVESAETDAETSADTTPMSSATNAQTDAEQAQTDDQDIDSAAALDDLLNASEKQRRALAAFELSPEPLSRQDISELLDVGPTYLYHTSVMEDGLLEKVGSRNEATWQITDRGSAAVQRFIEERPDQFEEEMAPVPAITRDAAWDDDWDSVYDVETETDEQEDSEETEVSDGEFSPVNSRSELFGTGAGAEARKELESISKGRDESAYRCDLCGDPFDTFRAAEMHVNRKADSKHKGRSGNEPGVISVNQQLLAEISHDSNGHNGSVVTECDFDVDEETRHNKNRTGLATYKDGELMLQQFQGFQDRPVKTAPARTDETADAQAIDETVIAQLGLTPSDAFEIISSDASEDLRRRVFNEVLTNANAGGS